MVGSTQVRRFTGTVLGLLAMTAGALAAVPPTAAPAPETTAAEAVNGGEVNLRRTVIVEVARKAKDAVVYISTTKIVAESVSPFGNDPIFGNLNRQTILVPRNSLGSGFIIHENGYIVTNNHVVDRARKVQVQLPDERKFDAEVVSADPDADLAILKIDTTDPLPTLPLGDSSDLMIGEPVIAVGNPLGYSYSVSSGIVSAVHREIQTGPKRAVLSDLIQTDAAINPGNSGGPLLNAYGQVIGINTVIRSDAQNIGFAIQINRLRELIPALMDPAKAKKLNIPLEFAERRSLVPPATVTSQVDLITSAGLAPIESINGKKPRDIIDAYATLLTVPAKGNITVVAGGKTVKVQATEVPVPDAIAQARKKLGVTVQQVTPALAERAGLGGVEDGMLITEVVARSVAAKTGLQPGDVILQLGTSRVRTLEDFGQLISLLPPSGDVYIIILRGSAILQGKMTL